MKILKEGNLEIEIYREKSEEEINELREKWKNFEVTETKQQLLKELEICKKLKLKDQIRIRQWELRQIEENEITKSDFNPVKVGYKIVTHEDINIWERYLDIFFKKTLSYKQDSDCIPLKILVEWELASRLDVFEEFQTYPHIFRQEAGAMLVGSIGANNYLIARWGTMLKSLAEMEKEIKDKENLIFQKMKKTIFCTFPVLAILFFGVGMWLMRHPCSLFGIIINAFVSIVLSVILSAVLSTLKI